MKGISLNRKICLVVAALVMILAEARPSAVLVHPGMGDARINQLLNRAAAGDTVLFLPGTYRGPYLLEGVHGENGRPVVIRGTGRDSVIIDGHTRPGLDLGNYAFRLRHCSWIDIEAFTIRNCWTDLIRADGVSYLSVRHCSLYGGKRALFATGRESHHILMEHCSWEQDERLWTHTGDYSWDEIHHGIHRHYNGSFFQGEGISGVFVLRDNVIRNTFNAFRLCQINDGSVDPLACSNGEICRNTVINTSDNVLEPEVHATNLYFHHNTMIDGHAFVSVTEVGGGPIYVYGNTAVSLPGTEDGWTVFKISSDERALDRPLYIFNNSWQVDFDMIGSPRNVWKNDHIVHFNNACFSESSDSFGIYFLGRDNRFDYDCSNVPFPRLLTDRGFEVNGVVGDPLFMDPYRGDFRLKAGSPCVDRGTTMPGLITEFRGKGPDMGAFDDGLPVEGPAFRFLAPDEELPFLETPRVTRYRCSGQEIRLWFSVPLDPGSAGSVRYRAGTGRGTVGLAVAGLSEDGYCLTLRDQGGSSGDLQEAGEGLRLYLSGWPKGENGSSMTPWASAVPVELY